MGMTTSYCAGQHFQDSDGLVREQMTREGTGKAGPRSQRQGDMSRTHEGCFLEVVNIHTGHQSQTKQRLLPPS